MSDKYDVLKLENQLCFPLYCCSKEIVKTYKPFLDEIDLTYTQYIAMMVMWEHKEISVKEMGEYLFLDSGTLTPVIKRLESKGYLAKNKAKDDERYVVVSLTKEGEKLKDKAVEIPAKLASCIPLDKEDTMQLYTLLHKLMKK